MAAVSSPNFVPVTKHKETDSTIFLGLDSEALKNDLHYNFNSVAQLKQVHAHLIKTNTPLSVLPLPRVASVCALTPSFPYAQRIFRCLDEPELMFWNSCLKTYAESSSPLDAILFFYQLREHDVLPDCFTCSFVLKPCIQLLDLLHGRIVHGYMEKLGLQTNMFTQNMMVHLYASCGELVDAMLLFKTMPQKDVVTWNIMITQLVKSGDINGAYRLFMQMPERTVRSWTAMAAGFVQCGMPKEAINLFMDMEKAGLKANEVTVVAVLSACADLGALDLGRRIHEYSKNSGFDKNVRICNTLIDMYIKCGCIDAAFTVFQNMDKRTVVSWSAMIQGLAIHGQADEALRLFSTMIEQLIKPNDVTFLGLLHACSHLGLVEKGREIFASMSIDYGIAPRIEHYGCMVDLLSRAGLLQEARDFIDKMPLKPNAVVWGALLGGCKSHKNIELAEEAISQLHELDPLNDGYYVVLSNIYADAKQWEKAAMVRRSMRDQGVKKTPGWSSITIQGVVHEFVAGDESHPQAEEIFKGWKLLLEQLRRRGYVPNTSVVLLVVDEKEKEKFLYRHSEKLALVFGLMNTEHGETIRIMKNLRVCEDCHAAFKLISEIVNREIVVRDRNRFHCFRNGSCSCRDYW